MPKKSPVLGVDTMGFPWATQDPFLFCVYHLDHFPKGNASMGPDASLEGRDLGQDFGGKDGWNMYHGMTVPGFPRHPHRGFETVTVARQGLVDHSDSLGATARYGEGDVQWMTAGGGIVHSEMIPLIHRDKPNPLDLFQIWLNLPSDHKMAKPNYTMLWEPQIPKVQASKGVEVTVIAGELKGKKPPSPPKDSWASVPESEVAIWVIKFKKGSAWTLPPAVGGLNRSLYFYRGDSLDVAGEKLATGRFARLVSDAAVELKCGDDDGEALLLQGRPIGEPVANYGPFVMNTHLELQQAFADYQKTQFGGWPWKDDAPVHPRKQGRFAKFPDGREETPPKA